MKYKIILFIFILAFIGSALLAFNVSCYGESSCEVDSEDKSFFNKTTNGYFGMAIFFLMALITFSHMQKPTRQKKSLIHLALIIGSLIAIYFLYLQFTSKIFCTYCLVIDLGVLIGLITALLTWGK